MSAAQDYADDSNALSTVADLARRATEAAQSKVERDGIDPTLVVRERRLDTTLDFLDLERYEPAPRRASGTTVVHSAAAFAAYVLRVGTLATTVWADQTSNVVTAVINDHVAGAEQGWRDHRVRLSLQTDPEWAAWMGWCQGGEGRLHKPVDTAEFLEQYGAAVSKPKLIELLEIAQTIRGTKNVKVHDMTDLHTGAVTFGVEETVGAKAGEKRHIKIPEEITVKLAPYLGYDPVELRILFRFRVLDQGGALRLRFDPVRPDVAQRTAFNLVRAAIAKELGDQHPVYLGAAPEPRQVPPPPR